MQNRMENISLIYIFELPMTYHGVLSDQIQKLSQNFFSNGPRLFMHEFILVWSSQDPRMLAVV